MARVVLSFTSTEVAEYSVDGLDLRVHDALQIPHPSLGNALSASGGTVYLQHINFSEFPNTQISIHLTTDPNATGTLTGGEDFSTQMETKGTITFVASDDETLVLSLSQDTTEPYIFVPTNTSDVASFSVHVNDLTDKSVTVTFNDNATALFERVNGVYVPVDPFERDNGAYVRSEPFERISGVYTQ